MKDHSSLYANGALLAVLALIVLGVASEMWLAPLRPGGSWLVLKIIPLLCCVRGVWRRDNYKMQWASMLILLYFTEGIVRATSDPTLVSVRLAWLEVALSMLFFYCTLAYLRPIKKAAKAAKKLADAATIEQSSTP